MTTPRATAAWSSHGESQGVSAAGYEQKDLLPSPRYRPRRTGRRVSSSLDSAHPTAVRRSCTSSAAGGEGRRRAREERGKTTALHLFVPSHALLQPSRSTTDMAALSMTYTVVPPPFEPPHTLPSLPTTDTLTYSLSPLVPTSSGPTDTALTPQEHLIALEVALGLARDDLNARLTGWKEAFGAAGLEKRASTKKGRKAEADGEDDGEEDEEE